MSEFFSYSKVSHQLFDFSPTSKLTTGGSDQDHKGAVSDFYPIILQKLNRSLRSQKVSAESEHQNLASNFTFHCLMHYNCVQNEEIKKLTEQRWKTFTNYAEKWQETDSEVELGIINECSDWLHSFSQCGELNELPTLDSILPTDSLQT